MKKSDEQGLSDRGLEKNVTSFKLYYSIDRWSVRGTAIFERRGDHDPSTSDQP